VSNPPLAPVGIYDRKTVTSAPSIPGIQEDIKKIGEQRARELGISPDQRNRVTIYKESIPQAVARGVAENLKAGAIMTAQKFGEKFDNWLNQQGISVRPFEAVEKTIREVKLRRSKSNRLSSR
jgi:sensor domain CHASE-containing protein